MVAVPTICCNINKLSILPTPFIQAFLIILRNNDYFPQHYLVELYNLHRLCSLKGRNWILYIIQINIILQRVMLLANATIQSDVISLHTCMNHATVCFFQGHRFEECRFKPYSGYNSPVFVVLRLLVRWHESRSFLTVKSHSPYKVLCFLYRAWYYYYYYYYYYYSI